MSQSTLGWMRDLHVSDLENEFATKKWQTPSKEIIERIIV
jgi:hypothetical protein